MNVWWIFGIGFGFIVDLFYVIMIGIDFNCGECYYECFGSGC